MIVTAMPRKNASKISGVMPRIVVPAASMTGRRRLIDPSSTARPPASPRSMRWSISSTSTIAFLMSMPESDRKPSSAVKLNAVSVIRSPQVTPQIDIGTTAQMISG